MGCSECKNKKSKTLKVFKVKYIKSFLQFLIKNIFSGFKHVSFKEYHSRLAICTACPFLSYKEKRCTDCGCWVENKAKFKSEDCPQGYWRKLDVRNK